MLCISCRNIVNGQEIEAYKLVHSFDLIIEDGDTVQEYSEQYRVKGLGLAQDIYINSIDYSKRIAKELSEYDRISYPYCSFFKIQIPSWHSSLISRMQSEYFEGIVFRYALGLRG
jgi:hypothetical protein